MFKLRQIASLFLASVFALLAFAGCANANQPIRPTVPVGPGYVATTRNVTWNTRARTHMQPSLQRNQVANFGHIQIAHGQNPSVQINMPNMSDITETRFIGSNIGPVDTSRAGVVVQNNRHTINFNDAHRSGILVFRLRARNGEVGYFSMTFERTASPAPIGPGHPPPSSTAPPAVVAPGTPQPGRPSGNLRQLSTIPSRYHDTFRAEFMTGINQNVRANGSVEVRSNRIYLNNALFDITVSDVLDREHRIQTVSANGVQKGNTWNNMINMSRNSLIINRVYEVPGGGLFITATYRQAGGIFLIYLDININDNGLVISNIRGGAGFGSRGNNRVNSVIYRR
ncbi:MAG: hypothetical protein FWD97_04830 [Defluviitaleaceae bacterium]|nr:hypothetical protein [Defluviitaleaceae bacterium]